MNKDICLHRVLHNKDGVTGRSLEIEEYIKQCFNTYLKHLDKGIVKDSTFLDIGCDYGYAVDLATKYFKRSVGIEPNPSNTEFVTTGEIFNLNVDNFISECMFSKEMEIGTKHNPPLCVFINHVLEHLVNPITILKELSALNTHSLFIAVPDGRGTNTEYTVPEGHLYVFTEDWFKHILPRILPGWSILTLKKCLRKDYFELWAIAVNCNDIKTATYAGGNFNGK